MCKNFLRSVQILQNISNIINANQTSTWSRHQWIQYEVIIASQSSLENECDITAGDEATSSLLGLRFAQNNGVKAIHDAPQAIILHAKFLFIIQKPRTKVEHEMHLARDDSDNHGRLQ